MWAAHPSLPLWKDVPPKPQPPRAGQGSVRITENALDGVNGLVALRAGELRHWAYELVWWTVSPGPLPDSVGMPPEFLNASPWERLADGPRLMADGDCARRSRGGMRLRSGFVVGSA